MSSCGLSTTSGIIEESAGIVAVFSLRRAALRRRADARSDSIIRVSGFVTFRDVLAPLSGIDSSMLHRQYVP
jgi:hypothetical protein